MQDRNAITGGFEALAPKPRQDRSHSRAITAQPAGLIERLKRNSTGKKGDALSQLLQK
jgi:hypothetical protein